MKTQKTYRSVSQKIASECVLARARAVNRAVSGIYDNHLKEIGIKGSQLNILIVISLKGQIQQKEICQILSIEKSTLSRNLVRMRQQGWVEYVPTKDARVQDVGLTKKGEEMILKAEGPWSRAQEKVKDVIGDAGVDALLEMMPFSR